MRVAILAQFPIHTLPKFRELGEPKRHYATWLPQLVRGFAEAKDIEFHWVTLAPEVDSPSSSCFLGQTFHVLPTASQGRASSLFRADRSAIGKMLDKISPDLVHGWGNEDVCGLAAVTSGRRNIVSVQGLLSHYILRNRLPARTYLQALIEIFALNRADQLICESLWACDMTRRRLLRRGKKIFHIEYGVQECFFGEKWQPDGAKPVAAFAGAVEPRKGIQDAVRAFSDPRLAHAELWVIGADESRFADSLKRTATPNVKWFGRLPLEQSLDRLRRAWCFVLPTRGDTGPMAVKEAMVIGIPVISCPCSGARDYIRDGVNGFLVPPRRTDILTDRLVELLEGVEKCRVMGSALRGESRQQFQASLTSTSLLKVYRETCREISTA